MSPSVARRGQSNGGRAYGRNQARAAKSLTAALTVPTTDQVRVACDGKSALFDRATYDRPAGNAPTEARTAWYTAALEAARLCNGCPIRSSCSVRVSAP
ncbi:hypothetical protein [Streptomyces triticirhizae]|uniref:hypothetical protein n=1 Tax=Streptomyces triticirhizae TaxID=2483353 RepID=UPI0018F3A84C|nr:hypothetical protein [Streptomyces triticirhizae]